MGSKKRHDSSTSASESDSTGSESGEKHTKSKSSKPREREVRDSDVEHSKSQPRKRNGSQQREPPEPPKRPRDERVERRPRSSSRDRRRYRDERRHYDRREDHRYSNSDRYRNNERGRNRHERDREGDYRHEYDRNRRDRDRNHRRRRSASFDHANAKWGRDGNQGDRKSADTKEKEKPNFGLSGKLTEDTNTYKGVVIKYSEPPEARKPKRRWRLYPFKGDKALQTLYIHRESGYLIGRDRKVVDLPVDHPSCSKQHAALQYRLVPFTRDDGSTGKRIRPYIIDLNSANGTYINNKRIDPSKYVELLEKDVIKFGYSSREYVLLHENSKDEAQDDDVKQEDVPEEVKSEVKQEEGE